MSYTPTDVMNEALIAIGSKVLIGDAEEGSREARVLINKYWTCLRQLLRGAHWDFARRLDPMTMLADATGNTPNVGNIVVKPWLYEYSYPINCAKARFVPHNGANSPLIAGNYAQPSIWGNGLVEVPPGAWGAAGAPAPQPVGPASQRHLRPAKFIISADTNYPPEPGQELWAVQGVGNQGRTVILTNVYMASLCYTEIVLEPQRWDDLFRAAMVSFLASEVALPLAPDLKTGMALRADQIKITKMKLDIARATSANEGWANNDLRVDWMDARQSRDSYSPWWGPGGERYDMGWDNISLADGAY